MSKVENERNIMTGTRSYHLRENRNGMFEIIGYDYNRSAYKSGGNYDNEKEALKAICESSNLSLIKEEYGLSLSIQGKSQDINKLASELRTRGFKKDKIIRYRTLKK